MSFDAKNFNGNGSGNGHNGSGSRHRSLMGSKSRKSKNVIPFCCCASDDVDAVVGRDDEFSPPTARGCTDLLYLIIFVIFCFIMILVAGFAFVYGNPYRLINGMDSFGNICGTENEAFGNMSFSGMDMSSKPYVLFFDLYSMDRSTKICVEQCPDRDLGSLSDLHKFYQETGTNLCRYDYAMQNKTPKTEVQEEVYQFLQQGNEKIHLENILCPKLPYYSSLPVLKRCIPKPQSALNIKNRFFFNIYAYLNSLNIFKQILGDLAVTWVTVLALTSIAFVISFALVLLIHWITAFISYAIMVAASLLSICFTGFIWWTYADLKMLLDSKPEDQRLEETAKNETAFLVYGILATGFTLLLLLVTFYLRKRVAIVVQLFREAGRAMCSMPCLVIQPFITYFALTGFFCVWLYVVLCLATADIPTQRTVTPDPLYLTNSDSSGGTPVIPAGEVISNSSDNAQFLSPENRTVDLLDIAGVTLIDYTGTWVKYMWWIYVIGLIWCSEFILACQQMVIASSIAAWYFSRNRSTLRCVIMESIVRLVKYHVGSVALGSAIITMVKIPRLMLAFSDRILRKWEDRWPGMKWLKKGCACCLAFFENCIKYIHHNAYTVIAIQGVNFCPASRLAFSALVQNALQVAVINSTGDFVLFLAKCITAAITGLIALLIFRTNQTLYFYAIPVLLTVVFSYFVAHCVISVFEMAVDTLFLCFCEDHNMNDGTDGKEFYAPDSLLKYMTEDAVDAVAPGRRPGYVYPDSDHSKSEKGNGKSPLKVPIELSAIPEEAIPMNSKVYSPTTTHNSSV